MAPSTVKYLTDFAQRLAAWKRDAHVRLGERSGLERTTGARGRSSELCVWLVGGRVVGVHMV